MFYRHQQERKVLGPGLLDSSHSIPHSGRAISEIRAEFIAGNYNDAHIYVPLLKRIAQMDDITNKQVAPGGNLDLNFYAKPRAVHHFALGPIGRA